MLRAEEDKQETQPHLGKEVCNEATSKLYVNRVSQAKGDRVQGVVQGRMSVWKVPEGRGGSIEVFQK